jgi:hypothetical protein
MADLQTSASGRPSVALSRDSDWEDVVSAVHSLPALAAEHGLEAAVAWAGTELESLISVILLFEPNDKQAAHAAAQIRVCLSEGPARVMCRDDRAGFNARTAFLRSVETMALAPTMRAVFRASKDATGSKYQPQVGDQ